MVDAPPERAVVSKTVDSSQVGDAEIHADAVGLFESKRAVEMETLENLSSADKTEEKGDSEKELS
jgi:hypothetical protein